MTKIDWSKPLETTKGVPVEYLGVAVEGCRLYIDTKHVVTFPFAPKGECVVWFVTDLGDAIRGDGFRVGRVIRNVPPPERWVWALYDQDSGKCLNYSGWQGAASKQEAISEAVSARGMRKKIDIHVAKLEPVEADYD